MKTNSAMVFTHYIKRRFYKPIYLALSIVVFWILTAAGVVFLSPSSVAVELGVIVCFTIAVISTSVFLTKRILFGIVLGGWTVSLLVLRRFDLLSWFSFAVTLILVGGVMYASVKKENK